MLITAAVFAVVAAAVAFYFFMLESLRWAEPETAAIFQLRGTNPAATAQLAYNLGFYNLFLAVGAGLGVVLLVAGNAVAGLTLMTFTNACMLLAAVVLVLSDRRMGRLSLVQGGPAALPLIFSLLGT